MRPTRGKDCNNGVSPRGVGAGPRALALLSVAVALNVGASATSEVRTETFRPAPSPASLTPATRASAVKSGPVFKPVLRIALPEPAAPFDVATVAAPAQDLAKKAPADVSSAAPVEVALAGAADPIAAPAPVPLAPADIEQVAPAPRSAYIAQLPDRSAGLLPEQVAAMQVGTPAYLAPGAPERAELMAEAPGQLTVRLGDHAVGKVALKITDTRVIAVQLGGLLDVLADKFDAAEFAQLRQTAAADTFVTLDQLRAAGLPMRYDPVYDELRFEA